MEQIINNRHVRIGMEKPDGMAGIKARSGLLISRDVQSKPAKITRLKNEKVIVHYLD